MLWTVVVASLGLLLARDAAAWLRLCLSWLPGVALPAVPRLARVPVPERTIMNGCWLALLAIWGGAVGALGLVDSDEHFGFGLLIGLAVLGLTPLPGLCLAYLWVASALHRLRDPLVDARCEAARVLMLALPAAFPVGALGYRVSETLFETGAGWELSGPGLLGPRWAGALSGAGVCVLGALWLRLRCARRAFDRAGEVA